MKVIFAEKDNKKVLESIENAMGGRKLAEMVSFALKTGKLEITISKLGTSTLEFSEKLTEKGLEYSLAAEKIAFAHRAFKDEVKAKIIKVVETAGGKVS